MKEALIRYIEQYVQLLPEEWDMLWQRAKPFSVPKETVLQHHGSVCDVLHFVNEGVVRHEHHSPTKHGVVWFSVEGELATDVYSFLSRKTGTQSLITCSPVQGWVMDYQALQTLGLRSVANAVPANAIYHHIPVQCRPPKLGR